MNIEPNLFDWDNPSGPQWVMPQLSKGELDDLFEMLVMFIGHDPKDSQRVVVLGTGFLVGVADTLVVLSAAHIFSWWTDQVMPPKRHALRGIDGDKEDFLTRLEAVIRNRNIMACVTPRGAHGGSILPIVAFSFNQNPLDGDAAIVQLAIEPKTDPFKFRTLPIDADPFDFRDIVMMAGFTGGHRELLRGEEPFEAGLHPQELTVRVGRVAERVDKPDGFRRPMYRVNIPSVAGMSGGPLIAFRQTGLEAYSLTTAAGVISRSRLAPAILLDHCHEGETWVAPIDEALTRKVYIEGKLSMLCDAVHAGKIEAHGRVAGGVEWVKDEAGVLNPRWRKETNTPG